MKRLLSVILSILFVILCCIPLPAKAEDAQKKNEQPTTGEDFEKKSAGHPEENQEDNANDTGEEPAAAPQFQNGTLPAGAPSENGISDPAQPQAQEASSPSSPVPEETQPVTHQPRLLVTHSLANQSVLAGSATNWTVTVKNCSKTEAIENIKVTLAMDGQSITPEKSSWYFEKIDAGKTVDLSQTIAVGKKAPEEPVPVQFQFEYEDKQGVAYTCTESIFISIRQEQQAELANLTFPENAYTSDTEPLTFQVYNTGLSTLYNVRVCVTGAGLFPTKDLFLGNMEAGASEDGEIPVFIGTLDMNENGEASGETEKYGETTAKIVFSYENEHGERKEQTMEIGTQIKKPQQVQLKVEKKAPKTNQWWISSIILGALVLLAAIALLYLRLRQFKRRVAFYEKA